ncbi:transposase [Desulfonatronospira sp.]|uniref:transposase n=1 Tax=Desulfonatronospira sp. TaxID=1962951 RepID=UPI0025BAA781|nr:transposase [Desulfonatronospira sp.]
MSSTPPSADQNLEKKARPKRNKKPDGQKGRKGINLKPVDNQDIVEKISLDINTLPQGRYRDGGHEKRQVFDLNISAVVTEYQVQVLINGYVKGKSAMIIFEKYSRLKKNFKGHSFLARGYYVSTVGLDEAKIRKYIQNQDHREMLEDRYDSDMSNPF